MTAHRSGDRDDVYNSHINDGNDMLPSMSTYYLSVQDGQIAAVAGSTAEMCPWSAVVDYPVACASSFVSALSWLLVKWWRG